MNTLVDFNRVLTDAYGEPMKVVVKDGQPAAPFTLGRVGVMACGKAIPDEKLDETKGFECWMLGQKIVKAEKSETPVELEPEEVTLLKDRIRKQFRDPEVSVQACLLVSPSTAEKKRLAALEGEPEKPAKTNPA